MEEVPAETSAEHLPSLRRGERIETNGVYVRVKREIGIFPRFGGGSGLKPRTPAPARPSSRISPRFGGGSGLKRREYQRHRAGDRISPRFGGGSGLKQSGRFHGRPSKRSPLASAGGAD